MKTYRASQNSTSVIIHELGEPQRELMPRYDLAHYAGGYAWGRPTLGALQLSLALLADALGDDERAMKLHKEYVQERIVRFHPDAALMLTSDSIKLDARLMEDRAKRKATQEKRELDIL